MARANSTTRTVAWVIYPGVQILDLTGSLDVFTTAARLAQQPRRGVARRPPYDCRVVASEPGPVQLAGLQVVAEGSWRDLDSVDTLIIPGAADPLLGRESRFIDWLQRIRPKARRVCSVCTGALILAQAGLLEGRRATTHWESLSKLRRHRGVRVDDDALFVRDGSIYTSAGISAGIDLALALIEEDLGRGLAMETARELVVFLKRPGGQSQFSTQLMAQCSDAPRIDAVIDWLREHLTDDLRVERLADRAGMSPRNFARVFARQLGHPPARFVELARLEVARQRLEESDASLEEVARDAGFGSLERMRRSFERHLRLRPSDYRRLHANEPARRSHPRRQTPVPIERRRVADESTRPQRAGTGAGGRRSNR